MSTGRNEKIGIVIPTLNAGSGWCDVLERVDGQDTHFFARLIVDSSSDDNTVEIAKEYGFDTHVIPRADFDHGGTRQLASDLLAECELLVFLTQDSLLSSPDAVAKLIAPFSDNQVGHAYGRQLPQPNASAIARHARLFNYPDSSVIKHLSDRDMLGLKTPFSSNSFSAYRQEALKRVGGFPKRSILSEDMYVAAKMLIECYKVAYCSEAQVNHSHNYTITQEFKRYFDNGVFHSMEPWIRETFGEAEGEGKRFIVSEISYLINEEPLKIFEAICRNFVKYGGYRLGSCHNYLPQTLRTLFSMNKGFWQTVSNSFHG